MQALGRARETARATGQEVGAHDDVLQHVAPPTVRRALRQLSLLRNTSQTGKHRVLVTHPTPAEGRERAVVLDPYLQQSQLPRIADGGEQAYGTLPFLKRGDLRIITETRRGRLVYWLAEEYAKLPGEQAEGGRLPTWPSIGQALVGRAAQLRSWQLFFATSVAAGLRPVPRFQHRAREEARERSR